jgi:hypothetical protein
MGCLLVSLLGEFAPLALDGIDLCVSVLRGVLTLTGADQLRRAKGNAVAHPCAEASERRDDHTAAADRTPRIRWLRRCPVPESPEQTHRSDFYTLGHVAAPTCR